MRVRCGTPPGPISNIDLSERTTVAELLAEYGYGFHDDDNVAVYLNGEQTFPDHVLSDGDTVLVVRPIRGEAPIPPGQVEQAIVELRRFTRDATDLIIVDPYILKPSGIGKVASLPPQSVADHVRLLSACTSLASQTLRHLHIISAFRHSYECVLFALAAACSRHQCKLTNKQTNEIHDRVWIKNREQAIVVGTSLNAIGGRRLAFLLDLPTDDLVFLTTFLQRKRLFPDP